jgi:hypothetical protein
LRAVADVEELVGFFRVDEYVWRTELWHSELEQRVDVLEVSTARPTVRKVGTKKDYTPSYPYTSKEA